MEEMRRGRNKTSKGAAGRLQAARTSAMMRQHPPFLRESLGSARSPPCTGDMADGLDPSSSVDLSQVILAQRSLYKGDPRQLHWIWAWIVEEAGGVGQRTTAAQLHHAPPHPQLGILPTIPACPRPAALSSTPPMISPGTRTRSGLCTGREAGKETMSLRHPSWTPCSPRYSSTQYPQRRTLLPPSMCTAFASRGKPERRPHPPNAPKKPTSASPKARAHDTTRGVGRQDARGIVYPHVAHSPRRRGKPIRAWPKRVVLHPRASYSRTSKAGKRKKEKYGGCSHTLSKTRRNLAPRRAPTC
ncbi:hypothetical protein B0H19DRAFT_1082596 [Mycena capillaripes]|nr:hypothetical protein B0H19DRAFT_1082596 [Mycena capillaripes]